MFLYTSFFWKPQERLKRAIKKQKETSTLARGALPMYLVLCELLSKLPPGIASLSYKS